MAFWTHSFIYDDILSENYDLFLVSEGASGVLTNIGSGGSVLYTKEVYRNPKVYLYGIQQSPVLTFYLNMASSTPICADKQSVIQRWLFGQPIRKKLRICQDDYQSVYFNCIMTEPTWNMVGNVAVGLRCQVICDSPFAWEEPRTIRYDNITSQRQFEIINSSDGNDYIKPITKVALRTATNFSINNLTTGKNFSMSGLSANEVVTIDSNLGIITSSTGARRYDNMSGTFFMLAPWKNNITIGNNLLYVEISYQNARRVSG